MRYILSLLCIIGTLSAEELVLKENNYVQKINSKKYSTSYEVSYQFNTFRYNEKTDILVKFKHITPPEVSNFENKYNLRRKRVLIIGYYLYATQGNIHALLEEISDESNILSVRPDWSQQNIQKY